MFASWNKGLPLPLDTLTLSAKGVHIYFKPAVSGMLLKSGLI